MTELPQITELHRLLWAKSAEKETPDNWKPVLAHLLDVAASKDFR